MISGVFWLSAEDGSELVVCGDELLEKKKKKSHKRRQFFDQRKFPKFYSETEFP